MNKISKLIVAASVVACVIGGVSVSAHAEGFKLPRGTGKIAKFIWKKLTCEKCMGLGKAKSALGWTNDCPKCGGSGQMQIQIPVYVCEVCAGRGGVPCMSCSGTGKLAIPGPMGIVEAPCSGCLGKGGWRPVHDPRRTDDG